MMDRPPTSPQREQGFGPHPSLALRVGILLFFSLISAALAATPTDATDPAAQRTRLLADLGVPAWHAAGWRGQGVKTAILDSGFRGYKAHLGEALPERVTVHSFRDDGDLEAKDSQHGILCGEVVHAIAPDAELLFANWEPEQPERFLEAVRWARRQGRGSSPVPSSCRPGATATAAERCIRRWRTRSGNDDKPDGVLFMAAAGNTAQRHWGGPFHDGGDGWHEWAPGRTENRITPWAGEAPSVELCWRPGAVYELSVRDLTADREAGRAEAVIGEGHCCAAVRSSSRKQVTPMRPESGWCAGRRGRFTSPFWAADWRKARPAAASPFPATAPR